MIHDGVITIIQSVIIFISVDIPVAYPNLAHEEGSHGPPVFLTLHNRGECEVDRTATTPTT